MVTPQIKRRHIPEQRLEGMRLGRHVHHDERSKDFVAETAPEIISVKHQSWGLPLDQGQIGSCTANALCGALNSVPNAAQPAPGESIPTGLYTEADAQKVYGLETQNEGSPWPPNDPGGSGLAVCQAAQQLKWITSYTHAFSAQDAIQALVLRPIICGIDWYSSFDTPDQQAGFVIAIAQGATVRGGHEIVFDEIDATEKLLWFCNSWGLTYGNSGRACMTFDTFDQLLQSEGDATVPVR